MKAITQHWLSLAKDDLLAARQLNSVTGLSNLVAFHVQQCIEKSFKALLEEIGSPQLKTHDLLRLHRLLNNEIAIPDTEVLVALNDLYTDSRYPGDMGLMPEGKPSTDDAEQFLQFADNVLNQVTTHLEVKFSV